MFLNIYNHMKKIILFSALFFIFAIFQGCMEYPEDIRKDDTDKPLGMVIAPADFDYATVVKTNISLQAPAFLSNAVFSLFTYKTGVDSLQFARATFDEDGFFQASYAIPMYIDTILVVSEYLGLTDVVYMPVQNGQARFDYRGLYGQKSSNTVYFDASPLKSATANGFTYMGSFNSDGVPSYLAGRDEISQDLLDDINQSLPERRSVQVVNPHFLAKDTETNIVLNQDADVWVTFIAEGAAWRNTLGYYTYQNGNAPTSVEEIDELRVIFPNASMAGSGGGLQPGDKVYLGRFPANTVIAWFLVANGWNGREVRTASHGVHFSQPELNKESNADLRQHMVLLHDRGRSQFILGFEDMPRDKGSDDDFNDALFFATVNPPAAVRLENVQSIIAANDADGDGINDALDEFPEDSSKSFNNFFPSGTTVGTLAFEDLWPFKGDYDMNDLVIEYQFNMITNAANNASSMEANFLIKNIGAGYRNGFAFVLPVSSSRIARVENQVMNGGYVTLNQNGTEVGVNETVIFVIENATPHQGLEIPLIIHFNGQVGLAELGVPPFNPFLVVNSEREREVHLPDMPPTSRGVKYLGHGDDNSNPETGRYYKSKHRNLPWAINIPDTYQVPPEKTAIDKVYPKFPEWANSGGLKYNDWYK